MKRLKNELLLFLVLFLLLSFAIHMNPCLNDPVGHIKALPQSPLGMLHPVYFTVGFYLAVVWPVRLAISGFKKVFRKRGG